MSIRSVRTTRQPPSAALVVSGHGANSQSGPCRPTVEPSGQTFASLVHPAGAGAASGHGANSQFGPCRPTAEPSGQIFASAVHITASDPPPPGVVLPPSSLSQADTSEATRAATKQVLDTKAGRARRIMRSRCHDARVTWRVGVRDPPRRRGIFPKARPAGSRCDAAPACLGLEGRRRSSGLESACGARFRSAPASVSTLGRAREVHLQASGRVFTFGGNACGVRSSA